MYRYNIASKVPVYGTISFLELASASDSYEPDLRRILRFAMVYHRVFTDPEKGFVAHTAASRMLANRADVYDGLGLALYSMNAGSRWRRCKPSNAPHGNGTE